MYVRLRYEICYQGHVRLIESKSFFFYSLRKIIVCHVITVQNQSRSFNYQKAIYFVPLKQIFLKIIKIIIK